MMKQSFYLLGLILLLAACKKNPPVEVPVPAPAPQMIYKDFHDSVIRFNRAATFDLDGTGSWDVVFTTQLTGDPLSQQDKWQWLVNSSFDASLPVNVEEQIAVMQKGDEINATNPAGYNWYNASSILLAQKIIGMNAPAYWDGLWKDASHRYIAIQINKNNAMYYGWIEVSFNAATDRLIVHRSGVSQEGGKAVKAGL
jgi:hypothetical protein